MVMCSSLMVCVPVIIQRLMRYSSTSLPPESHVSLKTKLLCFCLTCQWFQIILCTAKCIISFHESFKQLLRVGHFFIQISLKIHLGRRASFTVRTLSPVISLTSMTCQPTCYKTNPRTYQITVNIQHTIYRNRNSQNKHGIQIHS